MSEFQLDPQLDADTFPVASLELCDLRLMNDSRWPWLILVPRVADAVEWHELFADQRQDADFEIAHIASTLKALTNCEKINIASLGNMVRQLHIHVIARTAGDPNWPGPVWGFGTRELYQSDGAEAFVSQVREELGTDP